MAGPTSARANIMIGDLTKSNPHAADREDVWRLMHVNANLPVYTDVREMERAPLLFFSELGDDDVN